MKLSREEKTAALVPALERGLNILEALSQKHEGLAFGELCDLNIPKPSLFRLLLGLQKRGYVRQDRNTKKYQLGFEILRLNASVLEGLDLRAAARPCLQKLTRETNETAELVILDGEEILHIDKFESPESIRLNAQVGFRNSVLYAIAHGKVFLAHMGDEKKEFFIGNGLEKLTANTITNKKELNNELEKIKKQGYAFDFGEIRFDVYRCAAPIFGHTGEVIASVGIAGPMYRLKSNKSNLGEKVKRNAADISQAMGKASTGC